MTSCIQIAQKFTPVRLGLETDPSAAVSKVLVPAWESVGRSRIKLRLEFSFFFTLNSVTIIPVKRLIPMS